MAQLRITQEGIDTFLGEIQTEIASWDMMREPEVIATEPQARKKEADRWLACRLEQLRCNQGTYTEQLVRAFESGYLKFEDLDPAKRRLAAHFKSRVEEAQEKYQEAVNLTAS